MGKCSWRRWWRRRTGLVQGKGANAAADFALSAV